MTLGINAVIPLNKTRRSGSTDFDFKEHCLFCGERCIPLAFSFKHPDRWRRVIQCRTADDFKQKILLTCDARNDCQADEVLVRVNSAVSDLHAADGQYHDDRNIHTDSNTIRHFPQPDDSAFDASIEEIAVNKSNIWNSLEIKDIYASHGGIVLPRRKLIDMVVNHSGDDLIELSGNGVASILVFRSKASGLLQLVDDNDDVDVDVRPIAKTIKKECSARSADRDMYNTRQYLEDASEACSDLLLKLLAVLSPKLDHTNTALLIGNIITSVLTNRPTTLQITLGTILREKSLIEQFSEFGVTCSYDEVLRFKKSVAHAASRERHLQGLMDSKVGLVQTVADNFDANIASPNGLKSTHSLALLQTQLQEYTEDNQVSDNPTIRRLRKEELKEEPTLPVDIQHYNGPWKPAMSEACTLCHILSLRILAAKVITMNRAQVADYMFLLKYQTIMPALQMP